MASAAKTNAPSRILLAAPRGYCAGVDRAVQTVEKALDMHGPPVYVRKEIVHNKHVVEQLAERGAIFVEKETEVPEGELVVFSAHGVAPAVHANAAARSLRTIDATCPLVTKVHVEARKFAEQGYTIILIGHEGHEEVEGTTGEAPENIILVETIADVDALELADPEHVAFITQTTLSVDETAGIIARLRERFPAITSPKSDDICYATTNRQIAVKQLARECELVLVIGSTNSSNSNRLVEVAREHGAASHLIDNASQVDEAWLDGRRDGRDHVRRERARRAGRARWSSSSASAGRATSPSCAPSTRTSASCSRRRSAPSSPPAPDREWASPRSSEPGRRLRWSGPGSPRTSRSLTPVAVRPSASRAATVARRSLTAPTPTSVASRSR